MTPRRHRYDDVVPMPGLAGWAGVFFEHTGPRILALASTAALARRVTMGRWRWRDVAVAGAVVGLHPFAEWAVHVRILHRPPRRRGGSTRETFAARMHRLHHEDPKDIDLVLLPTRSVLTLVGGIGALGALARDRRRGATAAAVSLGSVLAYEWVHFLIHSPYRGKAKAYQARCRAHRLHHYRNERYWFGVVGTVADRVLGTAPERGAVPLSPTARTLTPSMPASQPAASQLAPSQLAVSEPAPSRLLADRASSTITPAPQIVATSEATVAAMASETLVQDALHREPEVQPGARGSDACTAPEPLTAGVSR